MVARIKPAVAPFAPKIQHILKSVMPAGMEPLVLFTTLARDERLFRKFFAGALLDDGHLTLRQREIVIGRTTARCGSEYEWGVHIALFGARANLTEDQIGSLVDGASSDACWDEEATVLLRLCDELHEDVGVSEETWERLRERFDDEAILELLMLAGFYRTVSYLTNVLQLPLEPRGRRFSKPED
ncbi:hypothetical protein GCM10011487_55900 [Steroidobacter agaridevorans]|uniref:Carboxymuconolactone decarboxylase-like domain-containing protein n=1 Tax=Steroidobacter agaridevorans TaxID=2695856 RepID=A0A829YK29_9GAMM|nr:carboxymuconolactone decarboxylase family protein [Steroidobacter agaridevorans]GFE83590.1 hypothetical protein GCM10011487_55900 [Steroidobacter agaridevorans]